MGNSRILISPPKGTSMIFGNFINLLPDDYSIAAVLWLTLCIGAFIAFFGGLLGSLNGPSWQRWQRRRQAEDHAANADPAGRFCCNCRWARWSDVNYTAEWKCSHVSSMRRVGQYLTKGEHTADNMYSCDLVREFTSETACGRTGKYWERHAHVR
jgi:hypothetical protein